ncbi:MAG: tetratricopeptide repeat protein, partial [Bacteroidota bacterium]
MNHLFLIRWLLLFSFLPIICLGQAPYLETDEDINDLLLARQYETGNGVEQNFELAHDVYLEKAATGGFYARTMLAQFYLLNGESSYFDPLHAHQILDSLLIQGAIPAAFLKGQAYMEGHGIEINYAKADSLLHYAASARYTPAMYALGYLYYKGFGQTQSYTRAFHLFALASYEEEVNAYYMLGVCYEKGHGTEQDLGLAREFYEKAISKGHEVAEIALANLGTNRNLLAREGIFPSLIRQPVKESALTGKWTGHIEVLDWSGEKVEQCIPLNLIISDSGQVFLQSDPASEYQKSEPLRGDKGGELEVSSFQVQASIMHGESVPWMIPHLHLRNRKWEGKNHLTGETRGFIPKYNEPTPPLRLILTQQEKNLLSIYPNPIQIGQNAHISFDLPNKEHV